MEFGPKKFGEIDLFDFTSYFGLDFLIFWPTVFILDSLSQIPTPSAASPKKFYEKCSWERC